ncbi:hypothetical protein GCM10023238_04940 [Streptomyces heliomycini]
MVESADGRVRVHLPVSVRRRPAGVLSVTLPDEDGPKASSKELAEIAGRYGPNEGFVAEREHS